MRVRVFENSDALAEMAATTVANELRRADGRVSLGLAGGGTPRATYARLRDEEVDWERVEAWIGDERWVPPGHPDHNGTMVSQILLDHVPARFHPVPYLAGSPEQAALAYERTLREILAEQDGRPRPDMVILGLGEDGHTASLFPGSPALAEEERLYVANPIDPDTWRVTATFPLLLAARSIIFLVTGAQKAEAVAEVLEGTGAPAPPARRILEAEGEVLWLLDRPAAGRLRTVEREIV